MATYRKYLKPSLGGFYLDSDVDINATQTPDIPGGGGGDVDDDEEATPNTEFNSVLPPADIPLESVINIITEDTPNSDQDLR